MPTPLLDEERCRRRSRLAARAGREAVPFRFAGGGPLELARAPEGAKLAQAAGTMPGSDAEALERVNAVLHRQGLSPLAADQVHVHYLEAGSSNYIPSRLMFLHESTLRNVAKEAGAGFAFMNSHRTGGLSAPAQLPYGRTFAGRFETHATPGGDPWSRTLLGVYMLAGVKPNGDAGPSTDDLSAAINAGTVFDVSLGLTGFKVLCDVCGGDLAAADADGVPVCPHVPGSTFKMTRPEVRAQRRRGVPDGVATYSFHDGHASEVSAVYNGAVPGAGFTRALAAVRSHRLSAFELGQARLAYGPLLSRSGPRGRPPVPGRLAAAPRRGTTMTLSELFARVRGGQHVDPDDDIDFDEGGDPTPAAPPRVVTRPVIDPAVTQQLAELQAQLKAETDARVRARGGAGRGPAGTACSRAGRPPARSSRTASGSGSRRPSCRRSRPSTPRSRGWTPTTRSRACPSPRRSRRCWASSAPTARPSRRSPAATRRRRTPWRTTTRAATTP